IRPSISDRIRLTTGQLGNLVDQDADATPGEFNNDAYAAPRSLPGVGIPLQVPFDTDTLPLIVPGPHVVSTSVPGATTSASDPNLVLNGTVGAIDVTFDRLMQASSFTA